MKTRVARLVLVLAVLAVSRLSAAAPISYYFSGTIMDASGTEAPLLGVSFAGHLDYDPDWPVQQVFGNGVRVAFPAGALEISVPGGSATSAAGEAILFRAGVYSFNVNTSVGSGSFLGALAGTEYISLNLEDVTGTIFGDPRTLPASLPSLASWTTAQIWAVDAEPRNNGFLAGFAFGDVSCWSTQAADCALPVPEPATSVLAALALAAGARRRRASWTREGP